MNSALKNLKAQSSFVSKRYGLILFVMTQLSFQFAHAVKKDDPRSKTEGQLVECIDCVVSAESYGSTNNQDLKDWNHNVAIFSKDPSGKGFIDPREVMDRQANPQLNAIGMIKVSAVSNVPPRQTDSQVLSNFKPGVQQGIGTGFLINECLVITNHHVAYLGRAEKDVSKVTIDFFAGASGNPNSPFAVKSQGKVVADGDYLASNDRKNDWAIIKLDQPVADPNNPNDIRANWRITPKFGSIKEAGKGTVASASFYQDNEKYKAGTQLWGQSSCKIWGKGSGDYEGSWVTDCPGIAGVSGSPVFKSENENNGKSELFAYGIMQSVRSNKDKELKSTDTNMNNMVPFSEAMSAEKLNQIIKDNPCVKSTRT